VFEDASTHDVASRRAATERTNDFGAQMIGMVCQRLSAGNARDYQGASNRYEQRKTANESNLSFGAAARHATPVFRRGVDF
jgi:hypothetical protein